MKYVNVRKLSDMTGLTVAAINAKRNQGKWLEGIHWRRASERVIYYCVPAIEQWIEGQST